MMSFLLQLAATVTFIGLAAMGCFVVVIQFLHWLELHGMQRSVERATFRIDSLRDEAMARMQQAAGAASESEAQTGDPSTEAEGQAPGAPRAPGFR